MRKITIGIAALMAVGSAYALPGQQGGGQGQSNPMQFLLIIAAFGVFMYFFMIRPEQRRKREKEELLRGVGPGDRIITSGGIHGEVKQVKEKTIRLQVDDQTRIEVEKSAIVHVFERAGQTEQK